MAKSKLPKKSKTTGLSEISKVVRGRRKDLNLTQKDLADYAGCGVVFIYDIEMGKTSVRLDKMVDVLLILGLELKLQLGKSGLQVAAELKQ